MVLIWMLTLVGLLLTLIISTHQILFILSTYSENTNDSQNVQVKPQYVFFKICIADIYHIFLHAFRILNITI